MQIRLHLSAEQVHQLDVTLGSDWQEGRSGKDLHADELDFEPRRNRLSTRDSAGQKPRKRVSARSKQRSDK